MILHETPQGSDEWFRVRAGCITGSMFKTAREKTGMLNAQQRAYVVAVQAGQDEKAAMATAGYKTKPRAEGIERALAGENVGDWSNAAKDYAFRLAIERISGEPLDEGFQTFAMRRGHDLEPEARFAHEMAAGVRVDPCGFVTTDDGVFGASADGFIGTDGGAEYKCLIAPDRLRAVLIEEDTSDFADQVQGGMWLTGRKYWDFAVYCPALAPIGRELWWKRWHRDDDYINALEADLIEFKALVDDNERKLRAA